MNRLSVSLIITTYNWPKALDRVLDSVMKQHHLPKHFEVIIADDGSTSKTQLCINQWREKLDVPLTHVWQSDEGFRAARIRNKAAKRSKHDYLIFIDGDCLFGPDFISKHIKLAERGWFVAGNRVLFSPQYSNDLLQGTTSIPTKLQQWYSLWRSKKINRLMPQISLPLGILRKCARTRWQGAKTCNLGVWREDFLAVNGLDESYEGWGFEDSDLVARLINDGIFKKIGKFCVPVFHLHHQEVNRDNSKRNFEALQQTIITRATKARKGIYQSL